MMLDEHLRKDAHARAHDELMQLAPDDLGDVQHELLDP